MNRVKKVIHATPEEVFPYSGDGVTAAILDTGIAMHPDIAGRVVAFKDICQNHTRPYDDSGHGTHVAGCLCGNGSCLQGMYRGIAPGCRIVVCKILDREGEGSVQDMMKGIRYVLDTRKLYHTRILNVSVGIGEMDKEREQEKLIACLEEAWEAGLFVVVAAGNKGPKENSLSALGASERVIAVGCHDGKDFADRKRACENYSGRGPSGYRIKKPDIVSPGTGIISCNAWYKKNHFGKIINPYTAKDGSSMSVPAVSGAAALLWQKYPRFTNEQIRERLLFSARDLGEEWGKQGWGMLDVAGALNGQGPVDAF